MNNYMYVKGSSIKSGQHASTDGNFSKEIKTIKKTQMEMQEMENKRTVMKNSGGHLSYANQPIRSLHLQPSPLSNFHSGRHHLL